MNLEFYPAGVRLSGGRAVSKENQRGGGPRGTIKGISPEAASRLRWFLVTMHVPGATPWGITRTIHRPARPDDWRACSDRWRHAIDKRGWSEVWRVELQPRQGGKLPVAHAHSVLWLPEGSELGDVRDLWLQCTRETEDEAARKHSVAGHVLPCGGWASYVAAHSGKHKEEQAGWRGKQWGVIGRHRFQRLPAAMAEVTPDEGRWFTRLLRRWASSRYRDKDGRRLRIWAREQGFNRVMDGSAVPALLTAARRILTQTADPMREPF